MGFPKSSKFLKSYVNHLKILTLFNYFKLIDESLVRWLARPAVLNAAAVQGVESSFTRRCMSLPITMPGSDAVASSGRKRDRTLTVTERAKIWIR
jgi:hypothetical protein